MPYSWTRYIAADETQFADLVRRSRLVIGQLGGGQAGVFRERGGLSLFFTAGAGDVIGSVLQLPLVDCAPPEQLSVEHVAGPFDEVDWYFVTAEDEQQMMMDDYLNELDEHGMLPPEDELEPRHAQG